MDSVILFAVAMFCGFIAGRVSTKHEPPQLSTTEQKLRDQLTVAENLNLSLKQDLETAKETIWKLKNANTNKQN